MKIAVFSGKRYYGDNWYHIDGDITISHLNGKDVFLKKYDNNSISLLYACHGIAYFDRQEVIDLFEYWKRVLKPGGILRIATPDFSVMSKLYNSGNIDLSSILGPMYGQMKLNGRKIYHKTIYDFNSLEQILKSCGFKDVHFYDWKLTEHANVDDHSQAYFPHMDKENGTLISLNIECTK